MSPGCLVTIGRNFPNSWRPESNLDVPPCPCLDQIPAQDGDLPETGVPLEWERLLSSVFIADPRNGTRVSTVVLVSDDGDTYFEERRFGPDGDPAGESRFSF
mgnify:CR=1 FL=1